MSTQKHRRLYIDFHITIADAPPPDVQEPSDAEYAIRQARLLAAVKANPDVLERWMHELITARTEEKSWGYWTNTLMGSDIAYQELLKPAIDTLPTDDQDFFAEAERLNMFEELTDLFQQSFSIEEELPEIVEQEEIS